MFQAQLNSAGLLALVPAGCWLTRAPAPEDAHAAEVAKRKKDREERQRLKADRRRKQAKPAVVEVNAGGPSVQPAPAAASEASPAPAAHPGSVPAVRRPVPDTPIAFLFPGQGSQAVGMLKVLPCLARQPTSLTERLVTRLHCRRLRVVCCPVWHHVRQRAMHSGSNCRRDCHSPQLQCMTAPRGCNGADLAASALSLSSIA